MEGKCLTPLFPFPLFSLSAFQSFTECMRRDGGGGVFGWDVLIANGVFLAFLYGLMVTGKVWMDSRVLAEDARGAVV